MQPIDFLHTELENISNDFPQVHIRYGYNPVIRTFIVELLPLEEYNSNNKLDDAWIPLSFRFREKFINDEIAFISSDSELRIANVIGEFNIPTSSFDMISDFFDVIANAEVNLVFPSSMSVNPKIIGFSIEGLLKCPKQSINESYNEDILSQAA